MGKDRRSIGSLRMLGAAATSFLLLVAGFAFGVSQPAGATPTALHVVSPSAATLASRTAVLGAANRLVALQNSDGAWNWIITNQTSPGGSSAHNTIGVTAQALLDAYQISHDARYLSAAESAGNYFKTHNAQNGFDIVFLYDLGTTSGDSTYTALASTMLSNVADSQVWANDPYNGATCDPSGCTGMQLLTAYEAFYPANDGRVPWGLASYVQAAELIGGHAQWAADLQQVIEGFLTSGSYISSVGDYTLGLTGGVEAAALVGATPSSTLMGELTAMQDPTTGAFGAIADGQVQATAYALMALDALGDGNGSAAAQAARYLDTQYNSTAPGGWTETDGSEYSENDGEAATALFGVIYQPGTYYTIQDAISAASSGDTISVAPGTYPEVVSINKSLTLDGAQAGITGSSHSGAESTVTGFSVTSASPVIDGLTINPGTSNSGAGIIVNGGAPTFQNNILTGYQSEGMAFYGTTGLVFRDNLLTSPMLTSPAPPNGPAQDGIFAGSGVCDNLQVTDNTFTAASSYPGTDIGLSCTSGTNPVISGNTSTGGATFVTLFNITGSQVTGNSYITDPSLSGSDIYIGGGDITTLVSGNTATGGYYGVALRNVYGDGPNVGTTITGNTLTGNYGGGISVTGTAIASTETVEAHGNDLSNNPVGIKNTSAGSVDATDNWWGSASGPGTITGVNATPWWTTSNALPTVPRAVSAAASNGLSTVNWTASALTGTSDDTITSYTVTASGSGGQTCTTTGATSCTVSGLTNGTAYTFAVTATNSGGGTGASATSNSVTPATLPGVPTGVTVTGGNASATVSWTAPTSNGGSAITGYTASASGSGGQTCTTIGATSCTVSGLTNGTSYTFTVTATSSTGTGAASSASNSTTPATVPGAPTGVTVTGGNASATVSWTAPTSNGGSAITGYTATASGSGGKTCTTTGATSCTVSGLINDTSYTFTVTATSSTGTGAASSASNSVTPVAPNAPPPTGVAAASFGAPATVTTQTGSVGTVTETMSGASETVSVPAGALPTGTHVSVYPVTNTAALAASVPAGESYILAFAVSWQAPNGSSPNATAPITMTANDPSIHAGDTVYEVTSSGLKAVGTATVNGSVTITFTNDPTFVIAAMPKLSLAKSLGKVVSKGVQLKMSCQAGAKCAGTAKLTVARKHKKGKQTIVTHVTVASVTYSIAPGTTSTLVYKVTNDGKPILARSPFHKRFRMSLLTLVTGGKRSVQAAYVP